MRPLSEYPWAGFVLLAGGLVVTNGLWALVMVWWVPPTLWVWSLVLGPWLAINAGLWGIPQRPTSWRIRVIGGTVALLVVVLRVSTWSPGPYAITLGAEWAFWAGTYSSLRRPTA